MLANRINCYNFMKKYKILDLSPKIFKIKDINDDKNNDNNSDDTIYY